MYFVRKRLNGLDPASTGFVITGSTTASFLGASVSTAGDINNDGYDDVIIGAPYYSSYKGAVYVIYGGPLSSLSDFDLTSTTLASGSTGFTILGFATSNYLGFSVSAAGDVDNDGYDDIIIGTASSKAYVIYGGPTASMTDINLSTDTLVATSNGFTITGVSSSGFGQFVNRAGDIDNDGYADIIIGASYKNSNQGAAYVIYGQARASMTDISLATTTLSPTSTGFTLTGDSTGDYFGISVASAGDVNNDGYDDIIIGASYNNNMQGRAFVIFGGSKSSRSDIATPSSTLVATSTGFYIVGDDIGDYFGQGVSSAGDFNNDGYDDIVIGAPGFNSFQGKVYVIYGSATASMANINLGSTTLTPTSTGFTILGEANGDYLGKSVSRAGDVNGDGYSDIIVGACNTNTLKGSAYVIYGGETSAMSDFDLSSVTLDPASTGSQIVGDDGDGFGYFVSTAGDVNNDGYDDIMAGAPYKYSKQGATYVIHTGCTLPNCVSCTTREVCGTCESSYVLYGECYPTCPNGTFTSNGECNDCPAYCLSCTSNSSCEACLTGFTLSNSLCSALTTTSSSSSSSSSSAETSATQNVASAVSSLGSVVSVGNSIFPIASLVSEVVQNTRYLNISITDDLAEVYQTFSTDLIPWNLPNFLTILDDYKTLPELFAQYDLDSPFLINFWSTMMTVGLALCILILCFAIRKYCGRGFIHSLMQKAIAGAINFIIVQAYGCLDNILFYFVLDIKTNPFNSAFSRISFAFGIIFILGGIALMIHSVMIVKNLHNLKYKGVEKNDMSELEIYQKKKKHWEVFYGDFNDVDSWSQCFMAFLVLRSNVSSLVLTILYAYPLMQTVFLIILDGAILLFMLIRKPFTTLRGIVFQYYFEIIALTVHICTFILSFNEGPPESLKNFICTAIIYLNAALVMGGLCFMAVEIHETINEKINEWKQRKAKKNSVCPLPEESEVMVIQNNNNTSVLVETSPSIKKHQVIRNVQGSGTRARENEIKSFSRRNNRLQPPSSQILNSSQRVENSLVTDDVNLVNHNQQRIMQKPVMRSQRPRGLHTQNIRIRGTGRIGIRPAREFEETEKINLT